MIQKVPLASLEQETRILVPWMASNATAILFHQKKKRDCKSLLMISMEVSFLLSAFLGAVHHCTIEPLLNACVQNINLQQAKYLLLYV